MTFKDGNASVDTNPKTPSKLLRVLAGETTTIPPVWMMRQAGRYLPEYRALRATAPTFLDFCYNPELAAEATLQPIKRFNLDAAILFSDILVIPDALGQTVSFESGEGPRLDPIESPEGLAKLGVECNLTRLEPVLETIKRVRPALPDDTALIGFCGAPWTVASYMIAGKGTPDQGPARLFAYHHPEAFARLINLLVRVSADYLVRQLRSGVDAVQIFDSWSGVLPAPEFEKWSFEPLREIIRRVHAEIPAAPVIAFPRGAGTHLVKVAELDGVSAVGLDTSVDTSWASKAVQSLKPVQGNLDPLALLAGGKAMIDGIDHILATLGKGPLIFNLGHGILPQTPIRHVEDLVSHIRAVRAGG